MDAETLDHAMLHAALDAVVITDAGGCVLEFNPAAERMFGYARNEAVGRNIGELLVPERYRARHDAVQTKIERGEGAELLGRLVRLTGMRADGSEIPVELRVVQLDGDPPRLLGFLRDCSAQRRAEDTESEVRQRLDALLDGSRAAIYIKRRDGRYMLVNREFARANGREPVEMVGKTDRDLASDAAAPQLSANDHYVLQTGEPREDEEVIPRDGEHRFYLSSRFPLRDADGTIYGVCTVSTDITAQKSAEREARVRAAQQTEVARLGNLATSELELGELMDEAVQTLAEVLGVEYATVLELDSSGDELRLRAAVGLPGDFVGAATVPATNETEAGYTLRAGFPVVVDDMSEETRFAGSPLLTDNVASGMSSVIKGDPDVFGVLSVHSLRRRGFSADDVHFLQAVAATLATAIARVRGAQLEQQLHQSQRLESLGQLAGGIAHDFNNLLAVILNYAEFLDRRLEGQDESLRADASEIARAAEQAADLTRQLLAFSRRDVVALEVFNLNDVLQRDERLLRRTLGQNIELRVSLDAALWAIRAGAGQIEQVVLNLAVNARDAMPAGGPLSLKTENVELDSSLHVGTGVLPPGRYVRLTVADSGTGIAPDVIAKIFDPFFTTKPPGQGTGLGLATVYGAVQEHGGQIEVRSVPESGTEFEVYLPATSQAVREGDSIADAPAGNRETILLVEDEGAVRELTRRILSDHGYEVIEAPDAEAAGEYAEPAGMHIDLLLTDVMLPGRSGAELSEDLRRRRPDLPVLFMSGYTGEAISRRGMLDASVRIMAKPFTAATLLRRVHEALVSDAAPIVAVDDPEGDIG